MSLTGYSVAQRASDLSMFLTGYNTGDLRDRKHVVKATIYTTRPSSSSLAVVVALVVVVVAVAVVVLKKVLFHRTMGGVIL